MGVDSDMTKYYNMMLEQSPHAYYPYTADYVEVINRHASTYNAGTYQLSYNTSNYKYPPAAATGNNDNQRREYINLGDQESGNYRRFFHLEFWIKPPTTLSFDRGIFFLFQDNTTVGNWSGVRLGSGGSARKILWQTRNRSDGTAYHELASTALTANTWNHVAVQWDYTAKMKRIYINGTLDASYNATTLDSIANGFQPIYEIDTGTYIQHVAVWSWYSGASMPTATQIAARAAFYQNVAPVKAWNGSAWVESNVQKVWDGSAWQYARMKRWNGSAFVDI
jgi:Concanavalin A-like lectin/glucanases superfamily